MTLSRRLFLEAASALGITSLAGQTTAETSEDGDVAQQVATKKAPSERFRQGHQLSARRLADTDTYDNEPNITLLNNNQLLLIYRRSPTAGGGHVNNGGYIVARLSNDWGETWTDPVTVADHPEYDTRNQSVIYDRETGIVSVHYRLYDADTGNTEATLFKYSTNHGKSWSDPFPVDLQYVTGRIAAPFGGYARTSNGLMTQWYGFDSDGDYGVVESLFSTDGGRTWGNNVLVGDSTDVSGRVLTEPVPVAYDEDRIWTWGRDNATADMFAIQSEDGGLTWGDPEYFNPTDMTDPTPAWFGMTNDNELTVVWGDRTGNLLRSINASAHLLWQNPSRLENEPVSDVAEQLADNNGDFAYATFTQLGRDRRHTLVTWYDEDVAPNIWLASLANGSGGRVDFDETVPQPPSTTGGTLPAFVQDGFGDGGLTDRSGQIIGTYTDPYQGRAITGAFRPGWNVNGGISVDNQQVLWQEAQAGGDVWMTYPGGAPTVGQWSFTFEYETLGDDYDHIEYFFIEEEPGRNWAVLFADKGEAWLRYRDGTGFSDLDQTTWGAGGTGDTERHYCEINRDPTGRFRVELDGTELMSGQHPYLPANPSQVRLRFQSSGGGSVIRLHDVEAGIR